MKTIYVCVMLWSFWGSTRVLSQQCGSHQACYPQVRQVVAPYVAPHVETYHHVETAEILVFVPTFTVAYAPPLPAPTAVPAPRLGSVVPQQSNELAAVLVGLQRITERLDALERRGTVNPQRSLPPMPPATEPTATQSLTPAPEVETRATIIRTSCAQCHTQGKLAEKVSLALVDAKGGIIPLSAEDEVQLHRKIYKGDMPPPDNKLGIKPLNDDQVKKLLFPEGAIK